MILYYILSSQAVFLCFVKLYLLVAMSFSLNFSEDVHPVVVAQGAGHLVVVHGEVILLDAPELGQTSGIHYLEHAGVVALPRDVVGVTLAGVVKQLLEEVP